MVLDFDIAVSPMYSISKAALNMAIAKFSAQYAKDGVLFLALSPGMVDTGAAKDCMLYLLPFFLFLFF